MKWWPFRHSERSEESQTRPFFFARRFASLGVPAWGLLVAVGVAVFLSPLASHWPDGLEKVAEQKGFLQDAEGHQLFTSPIPDYALPGVRNAPLATAAAGFLGTIATFGLAFGVARLLARRRVGGPPVIARGAAPKQPQATGSARERRRLLHFARNDGSRTGAVYKAEARLKILACLVYAVAVVTTPSGQWRTLALYAPLVLAVLFLARLPIGKTFARSAAVIPFSLLVAAFVPFLTEGRTVATFHFLWARVEITQEGLLVLGEVASKSWLSVLGLVILSSTTSPRELVVGLRKLGLPAVMAATLLLTLRYLTLFADEARQMERARRSRGLRPWYRLGIRSTAGMVASLFIRAYDTGERVHQAMLSRGFDGKVQEADTSSLSLSAVAACIFLSLILVGIRAWGANW